jgi:acyl-CoA reductase-like NAD-dependent aldehyde dehydrogenase
MQGPIVPTQPWTDESEVIARANNTDFGLGACVWSKDVSRAIRIGQQLEAGSVFINSSEKPTLKAAISGFKQSGIGFEGGSQALTDYCNIQVMYIYK